MPVSDPRIREYFSGKRVLLPGGSGFLGSHVADLLRGHECEPFVPRSSEYDLTTEPAVERLYSDASPEVVINVAAKAGGIGMNRRLPGEFFYENLVMGAMLVEHARHNDVQKFVQLGTVCSYPKFTPVPFQEEELWNGYPEETNAPYGIAKKALLVQAQAYREQYGLNTIFLMPVNLYGPRDHFDLENSHVIPALIRKMIEAKEAGAPVTLWGDGSASREFLYVEDCARAILLAAALYEDPDPVNIGAGFEITIKELAELIAELTGFDGEIEWDTTKPNGQPRRCLDTSRAREQFDFAARVEFRQGLGRAIEWFSANRRLALADDR
jgi:GDP-L-fucose synthase